MEDNESGEPLQNENENETREARTKRILSDPLFIEKICVHVANGGGLPKYCQDVDIRYSDALKFIDADKQNRRVPYEAALKDRNEWEIESILAELRKIASIDIREAFNSQGGLKPIQDIPPDVARSIQSIKISEIWEMQGVGKDKEKVQIGEVKEVKFWDKIKSLELLGKKLAMFIERHDHKVGVTLEDLVAGEGEKAGG